MALVGFLQLLCRTTALPCHIYIKDPLKLLFSLSALFQRGMHTQNLHVGKKEQLPSVDISFTCIMWTASCRISASIWAAATDKLLQVEASHSCLSAIITHCDMFTELAAMLLQYWQSKVTTAAFVHSHIFIDIVNIMLHCQQVWVTPYWKFWLISLLWQFFVRMRTTVTMTEYIYCFI